MKVKNSLYYVLLSELLFTILPIIILIIYRCYDEQKILIFYNTEWAACAIILFGQSIVKFSSGISNSNKKFSWQLVSLIISIIIIMGLIPSILVLVINIGTAEKTMGIYLFQLILFALSIICFFIIGAIGQYLLDEEK